MGGCGVSGVLPHFRVAQAVPGAALYHPLLLRVEDPAPYSRPSHAGHRIVDKGYTGKEGRGYCGEGEDYRNVKGAWMKGVLEEAEAHREGNSVGKGAWDLAVVTLETVAHIRAAHKVGQMGACVPFLQGTHVVGVDVEVRWVGKVGHACWNCS